MKFSQTELKVISQLGNGRDEVAEIAEALKISASQIYRIAHSLHKQGILTLEDNTLKPEQKTHVHMLLHMLSHAANLSAPLSGVGLKIYLSTLEPKTIRELEKETGLHRTTIFKKISQGRKMSLLAIKEKTYRLNEKIWPDVREFLSELKKYEESVDERVPANAIIYFKNDREIIFSTKEETDGEMTAFSAYEKYGIKLFLISNYYYLPKRRLTKKEVFMHSLYVAEKTKDVRHLIFIALFLAKYEKELSGIQHDIVEKIKRIFSGERIERYPTLAEINDRAEVYDIEVNK